MERKATSEGNLLECSVKDVSRIHSENPDAILVLVTRYYPRFQSASWKLKGVKPLWFQELSPTVEMLKKYKAKTKVYNGSKEKAFKRVFGPNGYTFISKVKSRLEGRNQIRQIKEWLNEGKDVYLMCYEKGPTEEDYLKPRGEYGSFDRPCHRYLLMMLILRKRLHRIFQERKYPANFIRWSKQLGAR